MHGTGIVSTHMHGTGIVSTLAGVSTHAYAHGTCTDILGGLTRGPLGGRNLNESIGFETCFPYTYRQLFSLPTHTNTQSGHTHTHTHTYHKI